jgi:hypothetical protein
LAAPGHFACQRGYRFLLFLEPIMTFLAFTRHSQRQYLAEVHPQLTEKKSPGRVGIFWVSAYGYKQTSRCLS